MATKTSAVNFVVAQNSGIVLNPATSNEMIVRGLQGMGLCLGFTMSEIVVSEMGKKIATKTFSGGEYDTTSVEYNFIPGDPSLAVFQNAALNATILQAIRLYVKIGCDFSAPDLISDPASGLGVGNFGDPAVDSPNGLWTGSLSYSPAGAFALFIAHKVGGNMTYTTADRTLATTDTDFITSGFEVGDTAYLDNVGSDDPYSLKIESVAAGAIVFVEDEGDEASLGDFTGGTTTAIHGATPITATSEWGVSC